MLLCESLLHALLPALSLLPALTSRGRPGVRLLGEGRGLRGRSALHMVAWLLLLSLLELLLLLNRLKSLLLLLHWLLPFLLLLLPLLLLLLVSRLQIGRAHV